jgi:hypothetical protein
VPDHSLVLFPRPCLSPAPALTPPCLGLGIRSIPHAPIDHVEGHCVQRSQCKTAIDRSYAHGSRTKYLRPRVSRGRNPADLHFRGGGERARTAGRPIF